MGYNQHKLVMFNDIILHAESKDLSYSNDGQRYWKNSRFKSSFIHPSFADNEAYLVKKNDLKAQIHEYHVELSELKNEICQLNSIEDIYDYVDEVVNKNINDGVYIQLKEDLNLIESYKGNKIVYICQN